MAGTVVAVFQGKRDAERAAQALLDEGVSIADITLVNKDAGGETGANLPGNVDHGAGAHLTTAVREVPEHDVEQPLNTADEMWPRAVVGVVIGAPVASLLFSCLIFFPLVDHILVANTLGSLTVASVVGGIIGGLIGALTSGGIPVEAARRYHAAVANGETLVAVLAGSHDAPHFQEVLRQHGGRRLGYYTRFIDTIQAVES